MRIIFRYKKIYMLNDALNKETDITKLVNYLKNFDRYSVPQKYYQAWKILVLGTSEYDKNRCEIIEYASNELSNTKSLNTF
ncbi:MAG: hypothetical protein WC389_20455 [Lutibacter sp.]|jgi:hypothetical protein